jgi:hypothetical protein
LIALAPIFFWELSLGVWLVVKGFRPSLVTTGAIHSGEQEHPGDPSRA